MDKFLETYNLPILNQEKIDDLNRLIISSEIESVINKLPANISPGANGCTGEFYQTYKKEPLPIFLKLFQKLEECTLPNHSMRPLFYPDTKTRKGHYKKSLQANISDEYR